MTKCDRPCIWEAYGYSEICKDGCVRDKYKETKKDLSLSSSFSAVKVVLKTQEPKDKKL